MYKKVLLTILGLLPCLVFAKSDLSKQEKADGMAADLIAKYTGLTVDEIESL